MAAVPALTQIGSGAMIGAEKSAWQQCQHSRKSVQGRWLVRKKELGSSAITPWKWFSVDDWCGKKSLVKMVGLVKHPAVLQGAALPAPKRLWVNFTPGLHTAI
ncbi:MAG: hypothetical protein GX564_09925 [Oligosphaeraceae bacterium]|nr:hypothetical protein [Oligosphaeraceae bacterium]